MRDLGTFRGTNHPGNREIIGEANIWVAKFGPPLLVALVFIVFAIIFGAGATVGPVAI